MRYKFPLALILALTAFVLPTSPLTHSAAKPTLGVAIACIPLGKNRLECQATVSGGTSPYSFQWNPAPIAGGGSSGLAIIACSGSGSRTIGVTATDSFGDTGSFSDQFQCCGSCDPL